jgi:pimeloyl-ACP methyl ester carboxylesterase
VTSEPTLPLHTTRLGDSGSPVVFLHGLFGQGRNFTGIAKALQPDHTSLLVDLPNHGKSGWTERFDYAHTADVVAHELAADFAAKGPVAVVGHSMGGKVAMALALRHPDLVERLVVVDISPVDSADMSEFEHLLSALAGLDLAELSRRGEADEQLTELIRSPQVRGFLLQNLREHPEEGWRWQANLELLRRELPVIGGFLDHTGDPYDGPTLWVGGDRSPYIQPEHADVMRQLFPRTRQVTVKGAGHWVHSEQPEAFVSVLRVFLDGAPAEVSSP